MTGKSARPDVYHELRGAGDELARIQTRVQESYDLASRTPVGRSGDDHTYLSAYLEAAHAHMVGEQVARDALRGTLDRPRLREAWRREHADWMFDRTLSDFAYHHTQFRSDVQHVRDWINRTGLPARRPPEAEAER